MVQAFKLAGLEMDAENQRIRGLRDRLWAGLSQIPRVVLNGNMQQRVPHNLNVSFDYVEGESLIMALKDLAVSSGSGSTSARLEPSYVFRGQGRSEQLEQRSIRF